MGRKASVEDRFGGGPLREGTASADRALRPRIPAGRSARPAPPHTLSKLVRGNRDDEHIAKGKE